MNQFFVLRYCDAVEEERSTMVIQAAELDRFGWTTFDVMETKTPSLIVGCHTAGATPTVATQQTSGYRATSTSMMVPVSII